MKTIIVIMTLFMFLSTSAMAEDSYLWPMAGDKKISSSFGEFREGHYHAGIDIRSFGHIGLPCLAIGNGYVNRVRIHPFGYGRALYFKLDSGMTVVYAHMHGFSNDVESAVYKRLIKSEKNWCDLFLEDGKYRFTRGDTVAFSGRSGTKAPHLHFEIRNSIGDPVNPLPDFFKITDDMPPLISALEVVPLKSGSRANGSYLPEILSFRIKGRNLYELADTLQLEGVFGFGISAWDEQIIGGYKMAPFSIELMVDDMILYSIENRTFSYGQSDEIVFEYDNYGKSWSKRFNLLFRKMGNSRTDRNGKGVICSDGEMESCVFLKKGLHRGELIICDAFGNSAKGIFYFTMNDYPLIETAKKLDSAFEVAVSSVDPDGGGVTEKLFESFNNGENWASVPLRSVGKHSIGKVSRISGAVYKYTVLDNEGASVSECFASPEVKNDEDMVFCECDVVRIEGGFALEIKTDRILAHLPEVDIVSPAGVFPVKTEQINDKVYMARFEYGMVSNGENIFHIRGRDYRGYELNEHYVGRIIILESGGKETFEVSDSLIISLESSSVKGRVPFIISSVPIISIGDAAMSLASAPFNLDFAADCIFEPLKISGCRGERVGLFKFEHEDSKWDCVGVPEMEGDKVSITESGTYAYLRDGLPPKMGEIKKSREPSASGFFKPYIFYIPIEDKGSGVDPYSSRVLWNGEWTVSQFDSIRDILYIPVPSFRSGNTVSLRVEVSDRVGNVAVKDFGFVMD